MREYLIERCKIPIDEPVGDDPYCKFPSVTETFKYHIRREQSPGFPFKYLYWTMAWDDELQRKKTILVFQRQKPDHFPYSMEDVKYIADILEVEEEPKWYFGTRQRRPEDPEMPGELCKTREEVLERLKARLRAEGDDKGKRKRLGLSEEEWQNRFGHMLCEDGDVDKQETDTVDD